MSKHNSSVFKTLESQEEKSVYRDPEEQICPEPECL